MKLFFLGFFLSIAVGVLPLALPACAVRLVSLLIGGRCGDAKYDTAFVVLYAVLFVVSLCFVLYAALIIINKVLA